MACLIAGWKLGANMNPIPTSSMDFSTCWVVIFRLSPITSRRSALPHRLVTDLFPCLATGIPAPAATKAAIVLILKVLILSPPVPHVSTKVPFTFGWIWWQYLRIVDANAVISSMVSPLILRAVRKEAIWASVALPDMISSMIFSASSFDRSPPSTVFIMPSFIIYVILHRGSSLGSSFLQVSEWILGGTGFLLLDTWCVGPPWPHSLPLSMR